MPEELSFFDKHYFSSYDHFGIHEEMLKDDVRTMSYRDAINRNRNLFKDKIVLDVGCGSGILSMFAAKAGAKHVIGVDRSDIINLARQVVEINGLSDQITLLHGLMEEVELPYPKVDIIISEWMGYFLLYEAMLDTVLYARDHYLKEGGLILPDKATMCMASIEDHDYKQDKIGFWRNVYGFDYSPFEKVALAEPLVDTVEYKNLVSDPCEFFSIDLYEVTKEDLAFTRPFSLMNTRDETVHGIVVWFDIVFSHLNQQVQFSTGPNARYTHWKQTVFYTKLDRFMRYGDKLEGTISVRPNKENPRDIDVAIDYTAVTASGRRLETDSCHYIMR